MARGQFGLDSEVGGTFAAVRELVDALERWAVQPNAVLSRCLVSLFFSSRSAQNEPGETRGLEMAAEVAVSEGSWLLSCWEK